MLPCLLALFSASCGGGGGGGGGGVATNIFLSRLYSSTAGTRTFLVTPPGDGSGNFNETLPSVPSPCAGGALNLISTNILDRQFVTGRHERLYVNVSPGTSVSIKGMWVSTAGGTGDFEIYNPPITFPDFMVLGTPNQATGRVHVQTGGPVAFAGAECGDFSGGASVDTGAYDFIFVYSGQASITTPFQAFPGNAFQINRNEIRPTGTRTITSYFGGGLGEVHQVEGGTTFSLQNVL
jgi:hypothetical protein